ncbi:hypothetical protein OS493_014899 [Desmophyllum pertusum]|uniref:Uncharacterized protein n=1 Tax=Desmophyllum pertusum TaxID=174260 RepID=A0A9W9YGK4_9CNID|nr:hypothetical protein OS493_014899 [Desmophyllum pertusum]
MAILHQSFACISLLLFTIQSSCLGAKFVMIPMVGRSHYLVHAKLGKELESRGHEVVIFVGECQQFALKDSNVRTFKCHEELKKFELAVPNVTQLKIVFQHYCDAILGNHENMNEVKSADLVIGDGMYLCSFLIADKFSLPHVTVLMSPLSTATASLPYNFAELPSYIPQFFPG